MKVFSSSIGVRVRRYWFSFGGAVRRGVVLGVSLVRGEGGFAVGEGCRGEGVVQA